MDEMVKNSKLAFALIGGALGWVFGGFDSLVYALIAFVAMDYITGVLLAIINKKVSSEIGAKGIGKKACIFILVALGNIIDKYIIGTGSALRTMLIMFYLSNEGISIIENAANLGLPIPRKLKSILQQLNRDNN